MAHVVATSRGPSTTHSGTDPLIVLRGYSSRRHMKNSLKSLTSFVFVARMSWASPLASAVGDAHVGIGRRRRRQPAAAEQRRGKSFACEISKTAEGRRNLGPGSGGFGKRAMITEVDHSRAASARNRHILVSRERNQCQRWSWRRRDVAQPADQRRGGRGHCIRFIAARRWSWKT